MLDSTLGRAFGLYCGCKGAGYMTPTRGVFDPGAGARADLSRGVGDAISRVQTHAGRRADDPHGDHNEGTWWPRASAWLAPAARSWSAWLRRLSIQSVIHVSVTYLA